MGVKMEDYNLKNIRKDFKSKGVFYTPPELALFLKSLLPQNIKEVYDPTCGNGSLLKVFDDDVIKYGQDINAEQVETARQRLKNFTGIVGDTLETPAFIDKKFECIIANYPFSIKWRPHIDERFKTAPEIPAPSKADYAFILHILYYLSDIGKAAVLNFPGILYRGGREGKIREWIVKNNYIEKIIHIEGNKFTDTKIATAAILFNKAKETEDILFYHNGKERSVSIEEIKENNYNLSPNTYIIDELPKVETDSMKLEEEARKAFLKNLESSLSISKFIDKLENGRFNFSDYLEKVKAIVEKFNV